MKFYDREYELAILKEIHSSKGKRMIHISGRRRVGKTRLILKFMEDKLGKYFFVEKKSVNSLMRDFQAQVEEDFPAKTLGVPSPEEFFRFVFSNYPIVVFDEFQNFFYVDESIFSTFQKVWDSMECNCLVILSGSYMGLMKKLFHEYHSPLYGRTDGGITIRPLEFSVICRIMKDLHVNNITEIINIYSVLGGVPKYYELAERHGLLDLDTLLKKAFAGGMKLLIDEPDVILAGEFSIDYRPYMTILEAIGRGKRTVTEISDWSGIPVQSTSRYIHDLTEHYELLKRKVPATDPETSKKGRYVIKDELLSFWFGQVRKNKYLIESLNPEEFLRRVSLEFPGHASFAFEEIIRKLVMINMDYHKVGSWWNRSGEEIDIVAINDTVNEILFGEVKWTGKKVSWKQVLALKEKTKQVKWNNGTRKEKFIMVSKSGFTDNCLKNMEKENIIHWDIADIEEMILGK